MVARPQARGGVSGVTVAVVVPVFRNADTVSELHARLDAALAGEAVRFVYVNDACPDGSAAALADLASHDPRVDVVSLPRNGGQHRAILAGLARADAEWTVVLDADLQDPPEAVPRLLARARAGGVEAVFGGRRGRYEPRLRLVTSRLFKYTVALLTGLPRDAGLFVVLHRRLVERLLALRGPEPFLTAMIACTKASTASVAVERAARPSGRSAYRSTDRLRAASRAVPWLLRSRRPAGDHNARQRDYFERRESPRMIPLQTPFVRRQVAEMVRFAGIRPGERVLDVGCGMGRHTIPLAELGVAVEGLDLTPRLLERLRAYDGGDRIPTHVADVASPPPALEGRFDAVIGFFVLHHLEDLEACFRGVARLVKPGGTVAFMEPNGLNPLYYVQIAVTPGMTWSGDGGVARMRERPVLGAMGAAGLEELRVERFGFLPPFAANTAVGARLEPWLEGMPLWRRALPFQLFGARTPSS